MLKHVKPTIFFLNELHNELHGPNGTDWVINCGLIYSVLIAGYLYTVRYVQLCSSDGDFAEDEQQFCLLKQSRVALYLL